MKILYVLHNFLPRVIAGTQLYTYYLAKELSKKHEVHLFFDLSDPTETKSLVNGIYDNIPFTAINTKTRCLGYAPSSQRHLALERFHELLSSFLPDVVHFQHILNLSPEMVKTVKTRKIPIVFTLHDFWLICHRVYMIKKNNEVCYRANRLKCLLCHYQDLKPCLPKANAVDLSIDGLRKCYWYCLKEYENLRYFFDGRFREMRHIFQSVDLFISSSNFLRNTFIRHGLNPNKIIYCKNGLRKIDYLREHRTARLQFGFMGGTDYHKGAHVLLKAFEKISDADLHVFGTVDEAGKQELLNGINNHNIQFPGFVSGRAKEKALSRIDIMIVPSICFETFSIVIQEAYMLGAPVIASNIGATAEFVKDGITGLHFKVGDYKDLRKKIQYLIDNPEKLDEMRANLPPVKSIDANAIEMEAIYFNLNAALRRNPVRGF